LAIRALLLFFAVIARREHSFRAQSALADAADEASMNDYPFFIELAEQQLSFWFDRHTNLVRPGPDGCGSAG
jgi:hypothetical protein